MATAHSRAAARLMISPAVICCSCWMIVPLAMTLYFSFQHYNLLLPGTLGLRRTCRTTTTS